MRLTITTWALPLKIWRGNTAISRELQDAYALSSQQKARAAIDAGRFKAEIVPVVTQRNGQPVVVDTDEQPRTDASAEGLAQLNPAFESPRLGHGGQCLVN
ncbi:acetyl-CoA acetyltransferase [Citrobacter koseri]|uniref:Acetyl-CoA acetyltransferase n=1 Tax=Citrobacter koseri TaxID=545 RepID=A0A447UK52_CITKO|nr:acetyl-CoA acetyltransferase [Citrobacter koseri]